jgi:uncharacterized protein
MTFTGSTTIAAPVAQAERILMLDSLRGIAILGILLMNMPGFALSGIVDSDPFLLNEQGTINYYIWYVVSWLMTGTQRALFSMLFGAGILLFIGRKENNLDGLKPADYFFRRQLWLIALSLFDVFILLWEGDILLDYACIGMLMFAFRNLSPKALIIAASICLLFMTARENRDFYQRKSVISKGEAVAAIDTTQVKLTDTQKDDLQAMNAFKKRTSKEGKLKRVSEENEKVRGDYATVYEVRTGQYIDTLVEYLFFQVWDVLIFMFLGMAFFKLGILTGDAPTKTYFWMAIAGLAMGLSLSYFRVQNVIGYSANWFELVKNVPVVGFNLDRVGRSVGILGTIMLLYKSGWFTWFFATLRPVGQMALTNYLSQSLICGLIFNGFAFGLFGRLQRYEIYLVVLAIWAFQIILCNVWMRYFFYGPCEWVWRSLTYWKRQPFVKA